MLKLRADGYIRVGEAIREMRDILDMVEVARAHGGGPEDTKLDGEEERKLNVAIRILRQVCSDIGLPTSGALLAERLDDPPQTSRELKFLADAVKAELKSQLFLHVPTEKAPYYESDKTLTEKAGLAFPTALTELREASTCYALGRNTATVFHAMRAAEVGLWALSADLKVSFPDRPNELKQWMNLIDKCESQIKVETDKLKGAAKDEALAFYSDAAVHFRCFKDAWRSRAAHARKTFDEGDALRILNHAREFFEVLAAKLRE